MEFEFSLIEKIEKYYGVYIGKKNIHDLAVFLSGVEIALYKFTEQRVMFDPAFQLYIESVFGKEECSGKHWDKVLSENKTQEDAFDMFYSYFRCFKEMYLKENGYLQTNY